MHRARNDAADEAGAGGAADHENGDCFGSYEVEECADDILRFAGDDGGAEGDRQLNVVAQFTMLLGGDVFRMSAAASDVNRVPAGIHAAGQARSAQDEWPRDLGLEGKSDGQADFGA